MITPQIQIDSYNHFVKITGKAGCVDAEGVYFWCVNDDFKINSDLWKGTRFIEHFISYWNKKMIIILRQEFPIVFYEEVAKYFISSTQHLNNDFFNYILDGKYIFAISLEENKIDKIIFPMKKGEEVIVACINRENQIFHVEEEQDLKEIVKISHCPIWVQFYGEAGEGIFFFRSHGNLNLAFCTTNEAGIISRTKNINIKNI